MKKYEILEHPAELRLRVYGKTLEELFENAALAMAQTLSLATKFEIKNQISKIKIKVKSIDINSLLVDFLSEILAKSQINKAVYLVSSIKYGEKAKLEAELISFPIERFDEDIKAVTYEDLDIKQSDDVWQTDLVFDI
jgi:SHS2 domain-containing protein